MFDYGTIFQSYGKFVIFKEVLKGASMDKTQIFQSSKEIISFFNELVFCKDKYVFRGYASEQEKLPKIIRPENKNLRKHEWDLLRAFEIHGANYFHTTDAFDFIAYAQHFGLPTRLLDFTFNPFVALAFALYRPQVSNDYYYISYCKTKEQFLMQNAERNDFVPCDAGKTYTSLTTKIQSYVETIERRYKNKWEDPLFWCEDIQSYLPELEQEIKNKLEKGRLVFVVPKMGNIRIFVQQGLFLLPTNLDEKEYIKQLDKNLQVIAIHKDLRKELLVYLETIGYDTYHLMPDLSNICATIIQRCKDRFEQL